MYRILTVFVACVGRVFTIEMNHAKYDQASLGESFGAAMRNLNKDTLPHAGDTALVQTDNSAKPTKQITTTLFAYDLASGITPSSILTLTFGTSRCRYKVTQLLSKRNPSQGGSLEQNPTDVDSGDLAEVVLETTQGLYGSLVETLASCPGLGRFTVIADGKTVGIGSVKVCSSPSIILGLKRVRPDHKLS